MRSIEKPCVLRIPVIVLPIVLAACGGGGGGGGGGGPVALSGFLFDDAVSGISYSSGIYSGRTDAAGGFSYGADGDPVTFTIGDIDLGTGAAKRILTPVDLVPGAVDVTDEHVINISRFLQTIDDDGDPSDDIAITQAVREAALGVSVDFGQTVAAFQSDPNVQAAVANLTAATAAGTRGLVPAGDAEERLHDTLLRVGGPPHCYSGSFHGVINEQSWSGEFSFTILPGGTVTGTFDHGPLFGEIDGNGAFVLTTEYEQLEGIVSSGRVTGGWEGSESGTLAGIGGCAGLGARATYHVTATETSNPDHHSNEFAGSLCSIEVAENGTDVTVECIAPGTSLVFRAYGTRSGTTFSAAAAPTYGIYENVPTSFLVNGTFSAATNQFSGSMSAGTDGALPDDNGNGEHEPITVEFAGSFAM